MLCNYISKNFLSGPPRGNLKRKEPLSTRFGLMALLLLCFTTVTQAQHTLIDPAGVGGFNTGSTFASNGWSVANEGANPSKWVVGTAGAMTGNAAYVSNNGGVNNTAIGYNGARTLYFYREVTVLAAESAMTLTFDVKSPNASTGGGWSVWVAPQSQTVVGSDTAPYGPFTYTPALSGMTQISFNHEAQAAITKVTAFIPPRFAGTTFKLIFAWTNASSAPTLAPAAIDNISLKSRVPVSGFDEIEFKDLVIQSNGSGNWSSASTWVGGIIPTPADDVEIQAGHTVGIDCKFAGAHNLNVSGDNAILQWATPGTATIDEFTISNDLRVSGTGALFNVSDGTNGKRLKVGHDITLINNGRLDLSNGSFTLYNGALELNGSTLQTVTADGPNSFGGTVSSILNSTNKKGVINQLVVTNTSTATPNISWRVDGVRINQKLNLVSGRVGLNKNSSNQAANNKIIIGNYSTCTEAYVLGNGFIGGTVSRWITGTYGGVVPAGVDFPWGVYNSFSFYQILDSNGNNRWTSIYQDASPKTSGEVALTYEDSNAVTTGLSVSDGSYTINNRYGGKWTFTTPDSNGSDVTPHVPILFEANATTGTFRLAAYAVGAYGAKDGSSRFMNETVALAGVHQDGTTTPFVFRKGLTLGNLTAAPIYIGTGATSMVNPNTAKVSATSGSWNSTSTWVGGVVPTACDGVIIKATHNVTVTGTAVAGNVTINAGGTLTSNSGSLTVGCSGNNSVFENLGTYTCNGGTLTVNGSVSHRAGSFFNHTGGNINVDGNNNGDVATSVGFGGTLFKIETSNLNLTGGKITIVDPSVNSAPVIASATSLGQFTSDTAGGATGTWGGAVATAVALNASTIVMAPNNSVDFYAVNQYVSGTGIAPGTFITATAFNQINGRVTITLSAPTTAAIAIPATLQFSSMSNGCNKIIMNPSAVNLGLAVGEGVSATSGIPAGTTIAAVGNNVLGGGASALYMVQLSKTVTGLATSPIDSAQTITFDPVTPGSITTVLSAADPNIKIGMSVSGDGIPSGTIVAEDPAGSTTIKFSNPIASGAPSTLSLTFYDSAANGSGAFVYDSPNHYAAGLNHTLQIGDGVSTQKGAIVTNGFNCIFQKYNVGGLLSLGNLIVNAPDGANRFMQVQAAPGQNSTNNLNVQGDFTIFSGSVFRKTIANSVVYVGGNLINNGSYITASAGVGLYLGNFINGNAVATSLPQTISGTGIFANNGYALNPGPVSELVSLTINNSSLAGVTLNRPLKPYALTLTNGIIHTSATNLLSVGNPDMTASASTAIAGGNSTSFIDGPVQYTFVPSFTDATFKPFPVGKVVGGVATYSPMAMAVSATGGAKFIAEAFLSNSGSAPSAYSLRANRWKVTKVDATGFAKYNVKLGSVGLPSACAVVQAPADQGAYALVSGTTPVYKATPDGVPFGDSGLTVAYMPNVTLSASQTEPTFTGYFGIAEGPSCVGTPDPGNTIASSLSVCNGQVATLSLQNATSGTNVTYQWQSSTDNGVTYTNIPGATAATYGATPSVATKYICNVSCSGGEPVASNAVTVTMANTDVPTVTPATVCTAPANLSASATGTLVWYDGPTSDNVVTTGTTYAANTTATYYVASRSTSPSSNGVINLPASPAPTAISANYNGLAFNATRRFNLTSVKVYPKNTAVADMTIRLYNSAGVQVPGTSDVTFTPNTNGGSFGATSQEVPLGYEVPQGTGYRLVVVSGMSGANTLAKTTATQAFPAVFNSLTITGNVTDLSTVTTTANNYNCFFDIKVSDYCETVRVPVTATVGIVPATVITTQPSNPTICKLIGATAKITVATSGASTKTYQWYKKVGTAAYALITAADATNYSDFDKATLIITRTATMPATGTSYYCKIVANDCNGTTNLTTNTVTLGESVAFAKVVDPKVVTKLSPALTSCPGNSIDFSLAAGTTGDIAWQTSTNDGATWDTVHIDHQTALSAINPALTYNSGALTQNTWFRVVATNGACSSTSSATIKIALSPTAQVGGITLYDSADLNTAIAGQRTVCSYQAPKAATATVPAFAGVTNSTTLKVGGPITGTVAWYKSSNYTTAVPTWSLVKTSVVSATTGLLPNPNYIVSSSDPTTLVVNNSVKKEWYKVVVTSGACSTQTAVTSIDVTPIAKPGTITAPKSVCYLTQAHFTSAAYIGSAIQWQYSLVAPVKVVSPIDGSISYTGSYDWKPFGGNSLEADIFLTGAFVGGTKFYVRTVVSSGSCLVANSSVKTIAVDKPTVAGAIAIDKLPLGTAQKLVCNTTVTSMKVTGNTGKVQWQYSTGGGAFIDVPAPAVVGTPIGVVSSGLFSTSSVSSTGTSLVVSGLQSSVSFRARVTSGACSVLYCDPVALTRGVSASIGGNIIAAENNICPTKIGGTTLTLTGVTVGTIQWQKWNPTTSLWANTGTLGSANLTTGTLSSNAKYRVIVYIGDSAISNCSNAMTGEFTVTVLPKPVKGTVTSTPGGTSSSTAICLNNNTKVFTISGAYVGSIQWQKSTTSATEGFTNVANATGTTFADTTPMLGANYYKAIFSNGCSNDASSSVITVYYTNCAKSVSASKTSSDIEFGVKAYPNPYAESFKLDVTTTSEDAIQVSVYDMLGKQVESREFKLNALSTEEIGYGYPTGVYNVVVSQGSEVKTVRIVKR